MSSNNNITSVQSQIGMLGTNNYVQWSKNAEAYFKMKRIWRVVNGDSTPKAAPTSTATADEIATIEKFNDDWAERDQEAQGILAFVVKDDIKHHLDKLTTSKEIWDKLKEKLTVPTSAVVWADYLQAKGITFSANDPLPGIEKLHTLFQKLKDHNTPLPEFVQVMEILSRLPPSYEALVSTLLRNSLHWVDETKASQAEKDKVLKVSTVVEVVRAEFYRQNPTQANRKNMPSAHKVSAVKHGKGVPPNWKRDGQAQSHKKPFRPNNPSTSQAQPGDQQPYRDQSQRPQKAKKPFQG